MEASVAALFRLVAGGEGEASRSPAAWRRPQTASPAGRRNGNLAGKPSASRGTNHARPADGVEDQARATDSAQPLNCWEFKHCGREAGGVNAAQLGVCPAYPDHGRGCAAVAGTLCGGKVQGSLAQKLGNCMQCNFYQSENYEHRAAAAEAPVAQAVAQRRAEIPLETAFKDF